MHKIRLSRSDKIFVIINSSVLILLFFIVLYPILFVLIASISDPKLVASGQVLLLPKGITFSGYMRILEYGDIWTGYLNTLYYTIAGTLVNLLVTLPCAYALSRKDMPGRGIMMTLFIITMYFNGGLIPSYLNMRELGLINTWFTMLITGMISAYNMIVARTFFANTIPWELHEAAYIDGASDFKTFINIVLPLSKPIIVVLALYYGIAHWNSYFGAMIYLNDRSKFPLQLFLREILIKSQLSVTMLQEVTDAEAVKELYSQEEEANLIKYCVIVVSTLPMMVIYPWLQKFFVKGVMIGSVKG